MPRSALPRSTPSARSVDARGVVDFLDALERDDHIQPHGLMLLRHGHVVAEGWWAPFAPDRPHRLAGREVPPPAGATRPPAGTADAWRAFRSGVSRGRLAVSLALAGGTDGGSANGGGTDTGDGDGWRVRVEGTDVDGSEIALDLPLGLDRWAEAAPPAGGDGRPLPVATRGAWVDDDTLHVDVLFVETPHRLRLTCRRAAGTLAPAWLTGPLWDGPLHEQRAPLP